MYPTVLPANSRWHSWPRTWTAAQDFDPTLTRPSRGVTQARGRFVFRFSSRQPRALLSTRPLQVRRRLRWQYPQDQWAAQSRLRLTRARQRHGVGICPGGRWKKNQSVNQSINQLINQSCDVARRGGDPSTRGRVDAFSAQGREKGGKKCTTRACGLQSRQPLPMSAFGKQTAGRMRGTWDVELAHRFPNGSTTKLI